MHFFEEWDDPFAKSDERYDCEFIERSKTCLKGELLDQMGVIRINDPKKRMFKGRVILTKNVADSILGQERRGVTLRERHQRFCGLQIVDGACLDGVAAINSVKSHNLVFLLIELSICEDFRCGGPHVVTVHLNQQVGRALSIQFLRWMPDKVMETLVK